MDRVITAAVLAPRVLERKLLAPLPFRVVRRNLTVTWPPKAVTLPAVLVDRRVTTQQLLAIIWKEQPAMEKAVDQVGVVVLLPSYLPLPAAIS